MFLIPVFVYILIAFEQNANLHVTTYQLLVIVIVAIIFSWLGNVASLKSIEFAPNPGYSLMLSKSYVVMTSIAAVFLFNAELNLKTVTAIMVIIIGSALVSIGKSVNPLVKPIWLPLSLLAFFCWGGLSLASKYLLNIGVGVLPRLVYAMIVVSILIMFEIMQKKISLKLNKLNISILLIVGISAAMFNYFMQQAFTTAPNIGYVNAINAGSISIVTIASYLLFKDELNWRKLLGVVIATIGLIELVV